MARAAAKGSHGAVGPGARIDDFTIAYRVRRGMNADIFAVWHHGLGTPLICKRLRPEDEGDAKWRRLLRAEGSALSKLNHPGIVRLIAQNQGARLPYLLLEHVGEKTLRDVMLKQGAFDTAQAVRILQHVGAAVAYVHDRGFLHRDLKPSNIILRGGRPVLLDFGIAWKMKSARRPPDCSGTPRYLAPEQVARALLTPATDVYGLGLLLFELLTGERAFRAGAAGQTGKLPLAERYPQLSDEPPGLHSAGQEVSRRLERTVARCLAREPGARFQSVRELLVELDHSTRLKVWPRAIESAAAAFDLHA